MHITGDDASRHLLSAPAKTERFLDTGLTSRLNSCLQELEESAEKFTAPASEFCWRTLRKRRCRAPKIPMLCGCNDVAEVT
jgi:hypothetical protein